jgi:phosphoenolpyruvate carboxykinase (GTP)
MELRVHGDVDCATTPTGCIPLYEDLRKLFKTVLRKDYSEEAYVEQFKLRIPENLHKLDRIEAIWREVDNTPPVLFEALAAQRQRLDETRAKLGDYVSPFEFAKGR